MFVRALLLTASIAALTGCSSLARIKHGKTTITAPRDNGTPATVDSHELTSKLAIPAGTKAVTTTTSATPATQTTPYVPAFTRTEWTFSSPTTFETQASELLANTGTIDTTIAKHRIDTESRRPLLYCAIASLVAGLGFMYVRYSSIAVMCFIGAGVFFAAWKLDEISPWVGALFLVAAVAGFAFYKRAEWDKDGDGIPDFLEPRK